LIEPPGLKGLATTSNRISSHVDLVCGAWLLRRTPPSVGQEPGLTAWRTVVASSLFEVSVGRDVVREAVEV
jgi:hypothetical protein